MKVKSHTPRIAITVYRNGRPVEYASPRVWANYQRVWALEDMLGDGTSVIVQKSVRSSAGTFQITIADNPVNNTNDSFYANVAPMDFVVIEMAHEPGPLTVVMRGFVASIERHSAIGPDGRPNNSFVIKGGDFGLLAEQFYINWRNGAITGDLLRREFEAYLHYGIDRPVMTAPDFYTVMTRILNTYLRKVLVLSDNPHGHDIVPEIADTDGGISTQGIQSYIGSLASFMVEHADTQWHELFIEDRDDGTYLVYRPLPFYGFDGVKEIVPGMPNVEESLGWIEQQGFVKPGFVYRSHDVLQSMSAYRSGDSVANLFAPTPTLMPGLFGRAYALAAMATGSAWMDQRKYPHCHADLFSEKLMEATMQQVWPSMVTSPNSLPADELKRQEGDALSWLNRRREFLARANRDNSVWESGAMTIYGDPAMKAGRYLVMDRGGFRLVAYAHTVTHVFQPYQSYTTIVQFDRGTGWLARQRLDVNPALTERAPKSAWEL